MRSFIFTTFWLLLAAGCATLRPDFETPSVNLVSFRALPSEGIAPRFEIGLRVLNPNSFDLGLQGMSYKVFLDDYEVVEGVASELPVVPAYGEADIKVMAAVSLLDAVRLVNDRLQKPRGHVEYRLQAKLDVGTLIPAIRIEETGILGAPSSDL